MEWYETPLSQRRFTVKRKTRQRNVLAQAREANEPGSTRARNPALPEANGWAFVASWCGLLVLVNNARSDAEPAGVNRALEATPDSSNLHVRAGDR